jgi:hypothetical protein
MMCTVQHCSGAASEVGNCISMQNLPEACTWHSIGAALRSCLCRLHLQWASAGGERDSDAPVYGSTDQLPQPSPKQLDAELPACQQMHQ